MKQKLLKPIVAVAVASFMMAGCASADQTTATESTSMNETQTMAGDTETEATPTITLSTTDSESYDEMFGNVEDTKSYDLISLAKSSPNLSTFAALVEAAGIAKAITPEGKYTIFAPTNQAFGSMEQAELERLMQPENKTELVKILQLHILPNEVASTRFEDNQRIKASEDQNINITRDATTQEVTIGGASIVRSDVEASNGVLHVIDGIITTTPATGGIDR
jgi:uncharacterized surface protein with fasciclin (FAS1) repeats